MDTSGNTKMSIEQKARAYDEALEDMRVIYPNLKGDAKLAVEHAFPELRESEDERIIRAIIDALYSHTNSINLLSSRGYQMENIEAWLEKQKYDRMKPVYDARESFESALEKAWNDYHNGYENVDKLEDDYVECAHAKGFREGYLFGIEKQKEQKPNIELIQRYWYMEGYNDRKFGNEPKWIIKTGEGGPKHELNPKYGQPLADEQKPAWSEEDEKMLNDCIMALSNWRDAVANHGHEVAPCQELIDWLKSLRPQPHTVSIKDATKFGNLEYERGVKDGIQSEKSRHWKPSEEQLNALNFAITYFMHETNYKNPTELRELYDDLLKLK